MCGDGLRQGDEQCDDANEIDGDGCNSNCQVEQYGECGNGMVQPYEQCDDANVDEGDGCNHLCLIEQDFACNDEEPSVCYQANGGCDGPIEVTLEQQGGTPVWTASSSEDSSRGTDGVAPASCDGMMAGAGKDIVYVVSLEMDSRFVLSFPNAPSFNAAIRLLESPCDPTTEVPTAFGQDGCVMTNNGSFTFLEYNYLPAGTYYTVVDGVAEDDAGAYELAFLAEPTLCGNNTLDLGEMCDDGNNEPGDGCAPSCTDES